MNIELTLSREAAALLAHAIDALEENLVRVVSDPEWIGETVHATTAAQRERATARLLSAAHNPYRDGPIRIHIWGEFPDLAGCIDYCLP